LVALLLLLTMPRQKKKKAHPDKPKKPPTAYVLFCQDERSKVKAENPGATFAESNRILGARWQEVPLNKKDEYKERANRDMGEYRKKLAQFQKEHPNSEEESDGGKEKKKKRKKDPDAPKNPTSAYFFYQQAVRKDVKAENPEFTVGLIAKAISERWNKMDEKDKKPYAEKAEKDRERYQREKAAYIEKKGDTPAEEPKRRKPTASKKKKEESSSESSDSSSDASSSSSSDSDSDSSDSE